MHYILKFWPANIICRRDIYIFKKIPFLCDFQNVTNFWPWSSWKTNVEGGLPKKGGLGQLADLRGGLARRREWYFWGEGWYPNAHCGYHWDAASWTLRWAVTENIHKKYQIKNVWNQFTKRLEPTQLDQWAG